MRKASFLTLAIGILWQTSCAPPQTIIMREKEHHAPPPPAIHVDRFLFGKANGPVDVLLVVDNTESFDGGMGDFETAYRTFLQKLESGASTRLLDYRVQVVSAPLGRFSGFHAKRGAPETNSHLLELFGPHPQGARPIFSRAGAAREGGYPEPLNATAAGLNSEAFKDRATVPLLLQYILGSDMGRRAGPIINSNNLDEIKKKLALKRNHLHIGLASKMAADQPTRETSYCREMSPPTEFIRIIGNLGAGMTLGLHNLCDVSWKEKWVDETLNQLVLMRRPLILTRPPFQPQMMAVRAANRAFRYGDDYVFNAEENTITFLRDPQLQEGDLIEASYFLQPNPPVLSGNPNPGDPPTPNLGRN